MNIDFTYSLKDAPLLLFGEMCWYWKVRPLKDARTSEYSPEWESPKTAWRSSCNCSVQIAI